MSVETASRQADQHDCRKIFAETLITAAREDRRIVAVCNDSVGSSNLGDFRAEFPDRLINVGIAEQNMVGVAAGLANAGLLPVVCSAAPFLTGRALEQIKADIAYSRHHVVLCGMSPGMAYGELGPTHHSIEDIAWLRAIHDLRIVVPADRPQTREALRQALVEASPTFLRVGRTKVPDVTPADAAFRIGAGNLLREGGDVAIIACGVAVARALDAADVLARQGIEASVVNMATIAPLDADLLREVATRCKAVVTVEEAGVHGGLGGAVAEFLGQNCPTRMRILGVSTFAPTGNATFLLDHFGLNATGIAAAAQDLLQ